MNPKLALPLPMLIGAALLLAACAGAGFRQASSWPGLASDGETIFLAFNEGVHAVDAQMGCLRWTYPDPQEGGRTFYAPPTVTEEGSIFIGDFNNAVVALRAQNGSEVWGPAPLSEDAGRVVGAPAVAGDRLLVPSGDGRLYARDITDGSALWSFPSEFSEPLSEGIWGAPVVSGNRVYVTSLDHNIYALDLATGGQLWSASSNLGGAIADSPVVVDGKVLAGTFGHELIALDEDRGRVSWTFDAGHWIWGGPTVGEGVAYFGDLAGQLHAVDVRNGDELWTESVGTRISASPAYSEDRVYVALEAGELVAIGASTQTPLWRMPLDGQLHTDPLVVGDTVYVATNGGEPLLHAVNTETGTSRWSFTPGESARTCPAQ